MGLVEQNVTSCADCNKPRPLETNLLALEIYSYSPLNPIPMTEGLIMLDIPAVEFLFKVHKVPDEEQRLLLEKIAIYHNVRYGVDKKASENKGD